VLGIAFPLILSTSAWSIQHVVDRVFLMWYGPAAVAASMPAGMVNFTVMSLFIGTATYAATFVAQYHGAGRPDRIGPAVWQGMYMAVIGGIVHLALIPIAGPVFRFAGHEELVCQYETVYFQVLCLGAAPVIASSAMSGFYAGRGRTWPVMWVNVFATIVNIVLNYMLIFGKWVFPELGIKGAAIGTVLASCFSFCTYIVLLTRPGHDRRYHTLRGWRIEPALFRRLMRFGLPNGVQFFLNVAGFTTFILLVGRLGTTAQAATVIAFNIHTISFMPMIGFAMAVLVVVGQRLSRDRPDLAQRGAYSGFHMTFLYMVTIAALYVCVPWLFIWPFEAKADPQSFEAIRPIAIVLLRFVAVFCIFDTMNLIFAAAIKGAGDTRFVMRMLLVVSVCVLIIPSYIALVVLDASLYVGWVIATVYIAVLGTSFFCRFLGGKWKSMRVIEKVVHPVPQTLPEAPTVSVEP
jgi:MATE family multidrug resistance protein